MNINFQNKSLFIEGYGLYLRKKSRRLQIISNKELIKEFPLLWIKTVVLSGKGIALSSDLIKSLCQANIIMVFLDVFSKPYAELSSPMLKSRVRLRQSQLIIDTSLRAELAKQILLAKMRRQCRVALELSRKVAKTTIILSALEDLIKNAALQKSDLAKWQGLEAQAAALYWQNASKTLPAHLGFKSRVHRNSQDIINRMLNYGYGVLYGKIWSLTSLIGLDPFAGLLHGRGRARPALIFDLVEPYRPLIDTAVFKIALQKLSNIKSKDLDETTRHKLILTIEELFAEKAKSGDGKTYSRSDLMQMEIRSLTKSIYTQRASGKIFEENFI